jgi:hypothetical protein
MVKINLCKKNAVYGILSNAKKKKVATRKKKANCKKKEGRRKGRREITGT